ncbi:hypothetical protein N7474_005086 [Penicillium riverlandense]|uniref:uncharacterized protein n=1 Tax=Penicillium riverlandense TaxID=1903569 RepID=UPI0025474F54|nr:uncharacterized protein N7474_005086 [Penicillium riverlandense]KAJ5819495.1 hypothetical protein N7474_005086 [Penicillium riverlandense]
MTFEKHQEEKKDWKLMAHIWEDVSFVIRKGLHNGGPKITTDEFWHWMQVTIDVRPPSQIVHTLGGDLILDDSFSGKLYSKGVQVSLPDNDEHRFRASYNLVDGSFTRDRRQITGFEEPKVIADIWSSSIGRGDRNVLSVYVNLLRHFPVARDVRSAERFVTETTAKKIWALLLDEAKENSAFYYTEIQEDQASEVIRKELKKEPCRIPTSLWQLLRDHHLILTPNEELRRCLGESEIASLPQTQFAQEIDRALRGIFLAEPLTETVRLVYVSSDNEKTSIAFAKDRNILYIHEKWLDRKRAHSSSGCTAAMNFPLSHSETFFCDHLVEEIYQRALALIQPSLEPMSPHSEEDLPYNIFRTCREKLSEMPRGIRMVPSGNMLFHVFWSDGFSRAFAETFGACVEYIVILHYTSCYLESDRLLFRQDEPRCDCPRKHVSEGDNEVFFQVSDEQPRFPMVARNKENALFGLSPPATTPVKIDSVSLSTNGCSSLVKPESEDPVTVKIEGRTGPETSSALENSKKLLN